MGFNDFCGGQLALEEIEIVKWGGRFSLGGPGKGYYLEAEVMLTAKSGIRS
jgi:hypothetical protein